MLFDKHFFVSTLFMKKNRHSSVSVEVLGVELFHVLYAKFSSFSSSKSPPFMFKEEVLKSIFEDFLWQFWAFLWHFCDPAHRWYTETFSVFVEIDSKRGDFYRESVHKWCIQCQCSDRLIHTCRAQFHFWIWQEIPKVTHLNKKFSHDFKIFLLIPGTAILCFCFNWLFVSIMKLK